MVLGRLLAFSAILLQIAVFLQPLLPEKYQISPVCETIVHALQLNNSHHVHSSDHSSHTHSHQELNLANHDTEKLNHARFQSELIQIEINYFYFYFILKIITLD